MAVVKRVVPLCDGKMTTRIMFPFARNGAKYSHETP